MESIPHSKPLERPEETEDEISLLDYLVVLSRHKKMIFLTGLVTFLLACGTVLLLPNIYTATARILPPPQEDGRLASILNGAGGGMASLLGLSIGGSTSADLYVGMLNSRTVADAIIDRFRLGEVYNTRYREWTRKALEKHVTIAIGKNDDIISIAVDDKDPARAAALANAFVHQLRELNVHLNLSNVGRERAFLEERLELVGRDLNEAEEKLKNFQEKNRTIRLDDQASAIIDAIARLKGELASKEVQLGVLKSYQTDRNPEVMAVKEGITQIKDQLAKLETSPTGKALSDDIFIPTEEVPELGVQYARLLRRFKTQETLLELLTKQYEIAKINEARNTSTIQVMDEAIPPDRKSGPRRTLLVLGATALSLVLAVFAAFFLEYLGRMPVEERHRWARLTEDLFPFRRRK